MDNLTDIRTIWLQTDTTILPDTEEMVGIIKKFRSKILLKQAGLILGAFVLAAIMLAVSLINRSQMVTTRIGEVCVIIAALILVITNIGSLKRAYKTKDCTNEGFIEYLKQVQLNRIYYHNKTQVAGLVFCSVGLLLYLFEFVFKDPRLALFAYTGVILYLLILWLIIRPRTYNRQKKELEVKLKRMETLSKQLNK